MSSKSYADAVSGSSGGEESVAKLSNTFWRKYQVEDEEDVFMKAIESSKLCTECHVNFGYSIFVVIKPRSRRLGGFLLCLRFIFFLNHAAVGWAVSCSAFGLFLFFFL